MENLYSNISEIGLVIIGLQATVFAAIILSGIYATSKTKTLRRKLEESLRTSIDCINSQNGMERLASDCRTRYANAAERIESVDSEAIVQSEIARFPVIRLGKVKWTFEQMDELLQGGPGFLITLGLIGTFWGLIANMSGLSDLLLTGEGISNQKGLIEGFSELFPAMGAAFATSLLGIFLSSCVWILGILLGISRTKVVLEQLLTGYLEQVVQSNCRCYSLVGESMERMETYLTEYLSAFSDHVGKSIEFSINRSIEKLVCKLSDQVDETARFVMAITDGATKLEAAGKLFAGASDALSASGFATEFSNSCEMFIDHTRLLGQASGYLLDSAKELKQEINTLSSYIESSNSMQEKSLENLDESYKALGEHSDLMRFTVNSSTQHLSSAVEAVEGIQKRGMTWLSMRAKTDSKLSQLNENLTQLVIKYSIITDKIIQSSESTIDAYKKEIKDLSSQSEEFIETLKRQEQDAIEIKRGLSQMEELDQRLRDIETRE
ncbi:putative conserved membrane protein [Synechococcus sp. MIT S9220]|uniref:hypothetical protein n=1 Tax=unclassified Synechococcus TaxID=2626047 RepID=UPI00164C7C77|nr:hypothetical protein [Synechococcus sp. MIT S9220]NOL46243.1 hypothetical protein [Synechococcus sp. MIT S9220]QNJ23669.1 putative conserved membrane protein [Synechococcus sp. MIT S9220]